VKKRTNRTAWWLSAMLAVVLAVLGDAAVSAPRAKSPRTVVDYYMLLPDDYFVIDRRSLLTSKYSSIVDIRNGWLRTGCDGGQVCWTICLFKRPDGSHLVAVSSNYASDGDWEPSLSFLTYQKGRWVDVTKATLTRRFSEKLGYELPRYGTTIKVVTAADKRVYDLVWTRGRFEVKRKSR
jgi:hypothetical protein